MVNINSKGSPLSKCFVTQAVLPHHIDPLQLPSKKKPFATILDHPFNHTVQVVLPESLYAVAWKDVEQKIKTVEYSRVIMKLSDFLEGDFFDAYIKSGNIMMLSEGRPGVEDLYTLKDGILRLELAKENYERSGLVGKPIRDGGRKHLKTRYAVEINLRLPSMLHGKKGFERLIWACKNVLTSSVMWLFYDFNPQNGNNDQHLSKSPIVKYHPLTKACLPEVVRCENVLVPAFGDTGDIAFKDDFFEDWALDVHEWLGLVALQSPRIRVDDAIDAYLSRYSVPERDSAVVSDLIILKWTGFIPALWIRNLFIELSKTGTQTLGGKGCWLAMSAYMFQTEAIHGQEGYTILRLPSMEINQEEFSSKVVGGEKTTKQPAKDYLLWEIAHNSDGFP